MSDETLTAALFRLVSDPAQVSGLHEILGVFCHHCRNTLNGMKLTFHLVKRGPPQSIPEGWGELEARYQELEQLVDRIQLICRPMALSPIRTSLGLLLEERRGSWAEALSRRDRRLEWVPPSEPAVGDFDPLRLGQGLDALVAWRSEVGEPGRPVQLRWTADDGHFQLVWEEPGVVGLEPSAGGADRFESLALPLMARVIAAHRGTLDVANRDGLRVSLRWPLDVRLSIENTPC